MTVTQVLVYWLVPVIPMFLIAAAVLSWDSDRNQKWETEESRKGWVVDQVGSVWLLAFAWPITLPLVCVVFLLCGLVGPMSKKIVKVIDARLHRPPDPPPPRGDGSPYRTEGEKT